MRPKSWDEKAMQKIGMAAALSVLVFAGTCAQQVPNPADCTNDATLCSQKGPTWFCDPTTRQCTNGMCMTALDCATPEAVACNSNFCGACSTDDQCSSWSALRAITPPLNFCLTQSPDKPNTCGACRTNTDCPDSVKSICDSAMHVCRACAADSDCGDPARPTCDQDTQLCRPACQTNKDCATGVCRKSGDYPEPSVGDIKTGHCAPASQIFYVNNSGTPACNDANPGTQAKPLCTLSPAVATGKGYINLIGSATPYPATTVSASTSRFVITGPGISASPLATLTQLNVVGGAVVLAGVQVTGPDTMAMVSCSGSSSEVYVLDSIVGPSSGRGIDSYTDCGKLYVERSSIPTNKKIGIYVGGFGNVMTKFRIVNNVLVFNGFSGGNEAYAVAVGQKATGYFAFNTVVSNQAGVGCYSATPISDSIVFNSVQPTLNVLNCAASRVVTTAPDFVSNTMPDLRLRDTPTNRACCIDQGAATAGQSPPPTDYYGTKRPLGGGYDIGFHEGF